MEDQTETAEVGEVVDAEFEIVPDAFENDIVNWLYVNRRQHDSEEGGEADGE